AVRRQAGGRDDVRATLITLVAADYVQEPATCQPSGFPQLAQHLEAQVPVAGLPRVVQKAGQLSRGRDGVDRRDDVQHVVGAATRAQDDQLLSHRPSPRAADLRHGACKCSMTVACCSSVMSWKSGSRMIESWACSECGKRCLAYSG